MKGTIVNKIKDASKTPQAIRGLQIQTGIPVHKGWGILMLFVMASIVYANYVVFFGTEGLIPKLMLIPSTLFVAGFLVYKAAK